MKRAPIVIAGTVAGLVLVLEFHTTPASLTVPAGTGPAAASGQQASAAGNGSAGSAGSAGSSGQQPRGERTAVGPAVDYTFGLVSVRVTVSGRRIVKVGIASLDDGSNPRSQFIDQQALPLLEQQALQAQSANIQGVSGASFTSAGFAQSLQAALRSLGIG